MDCHSEKGIENSNKFHVNEAYRNYWKKDENGDELCCSHLN